MGAQAVEYHPGDKVPKSVDPDGFLPGPVTYDAGPSCVTGEQRGDMIHVQNSCKADEHVRVMIAFGPDSPCVNLHPGDTFDHKLESHVPGGQIFKKPFFSGIELC